MTDVYANGMNIACKAAAGKTVAAMPDVCLSPPTPPAGPVPIPYPNTAMASDCTDGSKTVQIGGDEVMLKNKSSFKQSNGDEAATKSLGMGVVTHQIQGKVNFLAWSMDVKFEGENVPRHLDLTGHNEMSDPPNAPPWPYVDTMNMAPDHPCAESVQKEKEECAPPGATKRADGKGVDCSEKCAQARACALPKKKDDKKVCCHPNTTGDHLIESNCFTQKGGRSGIGVTKADIIQLKGKGIDISVAEPNKAQLLPGFSNYDQDAAPTACVPAPNDNGKVNKHNGMQAARDQMKKQFKYNCIRENGSPLHVFGKDEESYWTYNQASATGAKAHKIANPHCNEACTKAQLDAYHRDDPSGPRIGGDEPVRTYVDQSVAGSGQQWLQSQGLSSQVAQAVNAVARGALGG